MRLLTISFLFFSCLAFAQEEPTGITIYPHVGQAFMSSDSNLENDTLYGLGVGYRFDNPWAVELIYQTLETDFDSPLTGDADVDQWRVDGLYHFESDSNLKPFVSFGYGNADYDLPVGGDDESQLNAGAGIKWYITDRASLRGDFKLFEGNDDDFVDAAWTVGLNYVFGGTKQSSPAPAAAPVDGDADGDGVMDSMDQCPNTPAGADVDSRGCPRDDDGDGVYNYQDDCPNTTNRKARVDARGCYIKLDRKIDITLNLEFDFDSSEAREEHVAEVQKVADVMNEYPDSKVTMAGHTDSMGPEAYNQGLSERRAETIANMLTERFNISESRVSSTGYGESQPIDTNDTAAGRQNNRRVVAHVEGETEELEMK